MTPLGFGCNQWHSAGKEFSEKVRFRDPSCKQAGHGKFCVVLWICCFLSVVFVASAQTESVAAGGYERTYRQPKSVVERALKELQSSLAGRLPVLEGFALQGDHPLNRYQRAYYQSEVKVSTTATGGSLVRVTTKVTAWYSDPVPSHSGYQLLPSNGRLESDLLDQLAELLPAKPGAVNPSGNSSETPREEVGQTVTAPSQAPTEKREPARSYSSDIRSTFAFPQNQGLSTQQLADSKHSTKPEDPAATSLEAEAANLEELLKNQAHPKNLVAVKKTGTPVVASPSLSGATLFLASARDEFEMLDYNANWVHVRISGLSRGWIWRTSLEMPEGISDVPTSSAEAVVVAADLFQVTREEKAPFPGDWEPLRGKSVKIISVQKVQENEKGSGAEAKLEFAKSLLDKNYADLAAQSAELAGIVLIFDSVDGGMIAATLPTVQQWKAGALTDAALWHHCYFDPPETFSASSPASP